VEDAGKMTAIGPTQAVTEFNRRYAHHRQRFPVRSWLLARRNRR